MEPEWLHDDLDEMLPDGLCARPPRDSKAPVTTAAAVGSAAGGTKNAVALIKEEAGPAMAVIEPMDAVSPLGRSAVVEHSETRTGNQQARSTEHTAILAMGAAQPLMTMAATFGSAAAVDSSSIPVNPRHAGGSALVEDGLRSIHEPHLSSKAAAELSKRPATGQEYAAGSRVAVVLGTAQPVASQGTEHDRYATIASTQAAAVEELLSSAPLTSILAARKSAGGNSTVAEVTVGSDQVQAGTSKATMSSQQTKWGSDMIRQPSSIDRVNKCNVLDERLQAACARCAELEAELAAKEAAAQLARSENAELAARCKRLDTHLAEAEAAAQLMCSERSSLEERFIILQKEAAGHSGTVDALVDEHDEARSRCDTLANIVAERDVCIKKAVADLIQSRARCEELQQRVREVRVEVFNE